MSAALAAIFVLVVGYAVTATWQCQRLAQQRNESEQARVRAQELADRLLFDGAQRRRDIARQLGLLLQTYDDPFPGTVLESVLVKAWACWGLV